MASMTSGPHRTTRRLAAALAFGAALALPAPAAVLPAWTLAGTYDLLVDVGFRSADGTFDVSLEGMDGTVTLSYAPKGGFLGGGFLGTDFVKLRGSYSVAEDGVQHVVVEEDSRKPRFRFDAAVDEARGDFVGTYTRSAGFAGLAGDGAGNLTFARTPATAPVRTWRLRMSASMDRKGRVKGGLAQDGVSEDLARLQTFGGTEVTGGRVRGRVRTDADDGTTTAKVKVLGKDWSLRMTGPVDADGFHASADFAAAGFLVLDVPVVLGVGPGPEPPPPPTPKIVKVTGGRAVVSGDRVTITRRLPDKVFGQRADLTIDFPLSDANTTVGADPSTAAPPTARVVTAKLGATTYSSANGESGVSLTIQRTSLSEFKVICAGTIATPPGTKRKTFGVDLFATVQ